MVRYSEWLNDSWKMFSTQWGGWVAIAFIILAFNYAAIALLIAPFVLSFGMLSAMTTGAAMPLPVLSAPVIAVCSILGCATLLFIPPLFAGAYIAAFNQMRTGQLAVGDIWKGMRFFWQTNLHLGIVGSLIGLGLMFCFIPGIYLGICAFFSYPLIVEKRLGFWEAFLESRETIHRDFWNFLLYAILTGVISGLGSSFFILIIATYPFFFLMHAVAYRDIFGVEGAVAFPPTSPLQPPYNSYQNPYTPQQPYSPSYPPSSPAPSQYPPQPGTTAAQLLRPFSYCPDCGSPVQPSHAFCISCGFKLK